MGGACVDDGTGGYRCVCTELFIGNECRTRVANPIATPPTAPVVLKNATNVALGDDIQIEVFVGGAPEIHNGPYRQKVLNFTITGGTVTLGTAGITFGGDENSSASFTATGSTDNVNAALDAATFTPTPNLTGTDVATISFTCYYGDPFYDDNYNQPAYEPYYDQPVGVSNVASVTFSIDDSSLSAEDLSFENNIKLYPIPSKDILNIKNTSTHVISKIRITNVLGETVFVSNYDTLEASLKINVAPITAGVYFISLSKNNYTSTRKIIIN